MIQAFHISFMEVRNLTKYVLKAEKVIEKNAERKREKKKRERL